MLPNPNHILAITGFLLLALAATNSGVIANQNLGISKSLVGPFGCYNDEECHLTLGPLSRCEFTGGSATKACRCTEKAVFSEDYTKCLAKAEIIGTDCEENQQCTEGSPGELSECRGDGLCLKCLCKPGDIIESQLGTKCLSLAKKIGDECEEDKQCIEGIPGELSKCQNKENCACTPTVGVPSQLGDKCLPVIHLIGGECEEGQQCTFGTPGKYSDCLSSPIIPDRNICNCSEGYYHESGKHKCLRPIIPIGQSCQNDSQCAGEPGISSLCSPAIKLCRCLGGYIPSARKDDCLLIRNKIGDSCLEHKQCQLGIPGMFSICNAESRTCNCTAYSINEPDQHFCHERARYTGDLCQVNIQCQANLGPYSLCLGGICEYLLSRP